MKTYILFAFIFIIYNEIGFAQWRFPLEDMSTSSLTSAFGPRNKSKNEGGLIYDFHSAFDIGSTHGTSVKAMANSGTVISQSLNSSTSINKHTTVKYHINDEDYYIKYYHVEDFTKTENQTVTKAEVLGKILQYPHGDHLDIRYSKNVDFSEHQNNALNPGRIFSQISGVSFSFPPKIINSEEPNNELNNYDKLIIKNANDNYGRFFEFAVSTKENELDLEYIRIKLSAKDKNNISKNELNLLKNSTYPNEINYELRKNCGDITNSDNGLKGMPSVRIIPNRFGGTNDHIVKFRWYINETEWNNLVGNIKLEVEAADWSNIIATKTLLILNPKPVFEISKTTVKKNDSNNNGILRIFNITPQTANAIQQTFQILANGNIASPSDYTTLGQLITESNFFAPIKVGFNAVKDFTIRQVQKIRKVINPVNETDYDSEDPKIVSGDNNFNAITLKTTAITNTTDSDTDWEVTSDDINIKVVDENSQFISATPSYKGVYKSSGSIDIKVNLEGPTKISGDENSWSYSVIGDTPSGWSLTKVTATESNTDYGLIRINYTSFPDQSYNIPNIKIKITATTTSLGETEVNVFQLNDSPPATKSLTVSLNLNQTPGSDQQSINTGASLPITWNALQGDTDWMSYSYDKMQFEYTTDGGYTWTTLNKNGMQLSKASAVATDIQILNGTVWWTVRNTPSHYCKLRVTYSDNANVFGESNMFTIIDPNAPNLWFVYPESKANTNSLFAMKYNESQTLQYYSTVPIKKVKLSYTTDYTNNNSWQLINDNITTTGTNAIQSYVWQVPSLQGKKNDKCQLKLEGFAEDGTTKLVEDRSAVITIKDGTPWITVNIPKDLYIGSQGQTTMDIPDIAWEYDNIDEFSGKQLIIKYSADNTNWTESQIINLTADHGSGKITITSLPINNSATYKIQAVIIGSTAQPAFSSSFQVISKKDFNSTIHVSQNPNGVWPYSSVQTATNKIEVAAAIAIPGDIILVDDGTYIVPRTISILNNVTMKSSNGPYKTKIKTEYATFDKSNIATLGVNGGTVDGFTISNGMQGVFLTGSGKVQNCIIENNDNRGWDIRTTANIIPSYATKPQDNIIGTMGGGLYIQGWGSEIINCVVRNNKAHKGGGIYFDNGGTATNCVIMDNFCMNTLKIEWAGITPGVTNCTPYNNEVVEPSQGSGVFIKGDGLVVNSIIMKNNVTECGSTTFDSRNWNTQGENMSQVLFRNCALAQSGGSNFENCITRGGSESFTNFVTNDFTLVAPSYLLDAGTSTVGFTTDILGMARKLGAAVDIGVSEGIYEPHNISFSADIIEDPSKQGTYYEKVITDLYNPDGYSNQAITPLTTAITLKNPTPIYDRIIGVTPPADYSFLWSDMINSNPRTFKYNTDNSKTVFGIFKKTHATNNSGALTNSNQRKVVKTQDGVIHMVYESMGRIWYEISADGGTTWTLANNGKPLNNGRTAGNLAIAANNNSTQTNLITISYTDGDVFVELYQSTFGNAGVFQDRITFLNPDFLCSPISNLINIVTNDKVLVLFKSEDWIEFYYASFVSKPNLQGLKFDSPSSYVALDQGDSPSVKADHANFYITWKKNNGGINFLKIPFSFSFQFSDAITVSDNSGYATNLNPILNLRKLSNGNYLPEISWVGQNPDGTSKLLVKSMNADGVTWGSVTNMGTNVGSFDAVSVHSSNDESQFAWTENNSIIKYAIRSGNTFSSPRKLNSITGSVHLMQGATATNEALAYYVDGSTTPYEIKSTQLVSTMPTYSLQSGWNWFSLNCTPPNFAINSLFNQITFTEDDIIKGQTSYAQFLTGGGWVGSLSGLTTNEMYKIKLSNAINLTVDGDYVDLAANQIPLRTGYNWIAYSPSSVNSISNALAPAFLPVTGDKIKSKSLIAEYNGTNWSGSLTLLNPGEGYLYHSLSDKVLQWNNSASSKIVNVPETVRINKIAVPGWEVNPNKFENNMSVIAELKNVSSFTGDDVLAAFIGNDCRGSATPIMYNDKQLYFLVIHGDNSEIENVRLKFFSGKMKKKVNVIEEFNYAVNKDLGSLVNPVKLTLSERSLEIPTEFNLSQNFPNPFNPSTTIEFGLPESKMVRVEVFNSIGQRVKTLLANTLNAGYHSVTWDGTDDFGSTVSSGLYLYRINAGNFSRTRKMMFLK